MIVMSAEEYDSFLEDCELSNDPKFIAKMKRTDEKFARGEFVSWEEVKKKLDKKHGFQ